MFHKKMKIPERYIRAGAVICIFFLTLMVCHCSREVNILLPPEGDQVVSTQGTCVGCHSSEEMIALVAEPLPQPPEQEGA